MNLSVRGLFTLAVLFFLQCFGNTALAWTMIANFNDGVLGQLAQKTPQSFSGTAKASYFDDEQSYEGGMSAKLHIGRCEAGFGHWGGSLRQPSNLVKGDEVWLRVRTYMPSGFDTSVSDSYCPDLNGGGGRLKFLRVHTASAGGNNHGYNDVYINDRLDFIYEGGTEGWVRSLGKGLARDKWETVEMYLKLSDVPASAGGEALIRIWQNGQLLKEITHLKTLKTATDYADFAYIFTYWNGGSPKTQHMWIDDIIYTSDKPSAKDSKGNPYIGIGNAKAALTMPKPPSTVQMTESR